MRAQICLFEAACVFLMSCGDDTSSMDKLEVTHPATLHILDADQDYNGRTLEQWAVAYTQWSYGWTSADCLSAESDSDGAHCDVGQDPQSPVFFLASCDDSDLRSTVVTRTRCKVPAGKALLVPFSFVTDDDAVSADDRRPDQEIEESVEAIKQSMSELKLIADGQTIDDLAPYVIGPTELTYNLPPAPNWYTCNGWGEDVGAMVVKPSYMAGYFALFEPPKPGSHTLEYASVQSYFNADYFFHVKTQFTVE